MIAEPPLSASEVTEEHATESHAPYLKVWAALAVFTAVEYFYAFFFKELFVLLLVGLLIWAAIKAGLVGWFFMHLKFEGPWVYILIVPAVVLATILVLALSPDVAFRQDSEEKAEEEAVWVVPAPFRPSLRVSPALALYSISELNDARSFPSHGELSDSAGQRPS
jgi:cytochrome c oxidase subunit 4